MKKLWTAFVLLAMLLCLSAQGYCADVNWALTTYGGTWSVAGPFDGNVNTTSAGALNIYRTLAQPRLISTARFWFAGANYAGTMRMYVKENGQWVLIFEETRRSPTFWNKNTWWTYNVNRLGQEWWLEFVPAYTPYLGEWELRGPQEAFTVTAVPEIGRVILSWSSTSAPFTVQRGTTLLATVTENSYIDTTAPPNTQVTYTVTDALGAQGMVTVLTRPGPVGNLSATSTTSSVSLSWTNDLGTISRLYRNGSFVAEGTWSSYTDQPLAPETEFVYEVAQANTSGEGPRTAITVRTQREPPPPSAPQNLRVVSRTASSLTVAWDAVDGATGYKTYLNGVLHGNTSNTSYVFSNLASGTEYKIQVQGYGPSGDGEISPTLLATTIGVPGTVAGLTAQVETDRVTLTWNPSSAGDPATSYRVYRNGALLATVSSTTFTDNTVAVNTEYTYEVAGVNEAGEGPRVSIVVTTADVPVPESPTGLTAETTVRTVLLNWNPVPYAFDYVIRVADVVYASTTTTSYRLTQLTPATTYHIAVTARNKAGESPPATVSAQTLPGEISLTASAYGSGFVARWVPPSDAPYDQPDLYRVFADDVLLAEVSTTQYGQEMEWIENTEHSISVDAVYGGVAFTSYCVVYSLPATTPRIREVLAGVTTVVRGLWPLLSFVTAVAIGFGIWDRLRRLTES